MNHPDWAAFVAAIIAEPDDDTLRLVAADFLEENGEPDRAAFIRLQIALAGNPLVFQGLRPLDRSPEAEELRRRERAYLDPLSAHMPAWAAEECAELVRAAPSVGEVLDRLVWRRGFVHRVYCWAPVWLRYGAAVRGRSPIREVALRVDRELPRADWVAGLPALRGLANLDFYPAGPGSDNTFYAWIRELLPGTQIAVKH